MFISFILYNEFTFLILIKTPWITGNTFDFCDNYFQAFYSSYGIVFIGRTDTEAETAILWPPDMKNWLIGKDPDAGKDWRQEEKGTTEDEMVGWHHWLDGHEFEQALGVGVGQGRLGCCRPWGVQSVRHNWATELKGNDFITCQVSQISRVVLMESQSALKSMSNTG